MEMCLPTIGLSMIVRNGGESLRLCLESAARAAYRKALRLCPVAGDYANTIRGKLGYTEVRLGLRKSGFFKLRQMMDDSPRVLEHHDMLMKACVAVGNLEEAAEAAENTLNYFFGMKLFLRAAALRAQLKQPEKERTLLLAGLRLFPDSKELQEADKGLSQRLDKGKSVLHSIQDGNL